MGAIASILRGGKKSNEALPPQSFVDVGEESRIPLTERGKET